MIPSTNHLAKITIVFLAIFCAFPLHAAHNKSAKAVEYPAILEPAISLDFSDLKCKSAEHFDVKLKLKSGKEYIASDATGQPTGSSSCRLTLSVVLSSKPWIFVGHIPWDEEIELSVKRSYETTWKIVSRFAFPAFAATNDFTNHEIVVLGESVVKQDGWIKQDRANSFLAFYPRQQLNASHGVILDTKIESYCPEAACEFELFFRANNIQVDANLGERFSIVFPFNRANNIPYLSKHEADGNETIIKILDDWSIDLSFAQRIIFGVSDNFLFLDLPDSDTRYCLALPNPSPIPIANYSGAIGAVWRTNEDDDGISWARADYAKYYKAPPLLSCYAPVPFR